MERNGKFKQHDVEDHLNCKLLKYLTLDEIVELNINLYFHQFLQANKEEWNFDGILSTLSHGEELFLPKLDFSIKTSKIKGDEERPAE